MELPFIEGDREQLQRHVVYLFALLARKHKIKSSLLDMLSLKMPTRYSSGEIKLAVYV